MELIIILLYFTHFFIQGARKLSFQDWLHALSELSDACGHNLFTLLCAHVRRLKAIAHASALEQLAHVPDQNMDGMAQQLAGPMASQSPARMSPTSAWVSQSFTSPRQSPSMQPDPGPRTSASPPQQTLYSPMAARPRSSGPLAPSSTHPAAPLPPRPATTSRPLQSLRINTSAPPATPAPEIALDSPVGLSSSPPMLSPGMVRSSAEELGLLPLRHSFLTGTRAGSPYSLTARPHQQQLLHHLRPTFTSEMRSVRSSSTSIPAEHKGILSWGGRPDSGRFSGTRGSSSASMLRVSTGSLGQARYHSSCTSPSSLLSHEEQRVRSGWEPGRGGDGEGGGSKSGTLTGTHTGTRSGFSNAATRHARYASMADGLENGESDRE